MYVISGEFKVKDAYRDALVEMSLDLLPPSQAEAACLSYGFYEDKARPGHFLFFERWESRDGIANHFEQAYFKDFAQRFPDMIEGEAVIEIHEVASTETV